MYKRAKRSNEFDTRNMKIRGRGVKTHGQGGSLSFEPKLERNNRAE